jgi:hypothetical protein
MEKVKFSNEELFDITVNGVSSSDKVLKIALVAPDTSLVEIESMVSNVDNVSRIELLAEDSEVLRVYSGYTVLTSIEKKKDVIIATTIQEPTEEGEDPIEVVTKSDVIYITLRKESDEEARLASLEETVDLLVMSVLE